MLVNNLNFTVETARKVYYYYYLCSIGCTQFKSIIHTLHDVKRNIMYC